MSTFTHPGTIDSHYYRRPYLNFKEKITQLLLNPYSVILALFIIKLFFFLNSLVNSLEQAKSQTHLLYDSLEKYATNIVSFPHYMSKASNLMVAKSVDSANKGLVKTLQLMITASENLIFFIIELSIGTYACLLTAAIDDTAIVALNATESVINVANETLISFAKDLNDGLQDLSKVINEVINTVDDTGDALKHLFGKQSSKSGNETAVNNSLKHVNLTISNMKNWQINGNINDKIEKLKDEIPDFNDVKNFTQGIIDKPFSELKRQVSTHLNKTFDPNEMYVPGMATLDFSEGSNEIDKIYSTLIYVAKTATYAFMGLVGLAILGFLLYEFYIELKDWRRVVDASKNLNFANESYITSSAKKKYNIEVIKIMQDRKANFLSFLLVEKIFKIRNPILTNNIRWIISYSASPFLLPFLLLGLLGIFSVICQYVILHLLSKIDVTSSSNGLLYDTKKQIYTSFNESMLQWTNETNKYLLDYQDDVNNNLFAWVDTATMSINNTVTAFDKKMNDALDLLFQGTPLYKPIQQIVGCVIESKLQKIENAMTWITENVYLEIPELNPKEILAQTVSIKTADANHSFDENLEDFKLKAKEMIHTVLDFYKKQCQLLLYISTVILMIWFFFFLFGLGILYFREQKIKKKSIDKIDINKTENEKASADSTTLVAPFDSESFKTLLYHENSEQSITRFSKIIQNIKDQYLQAKSNYVRTPSDSKPKFDKYLNENYDIFTNDREKFHTRESSLNAFFEIDTPEVLSFTDSTRIKRSDKKTEDENNFINDPSNNHNGAYSDGRLSVIGENITSIKNAKCWTP
jgi:hypothetical protein